MTARRHIIPVFLPNRGCPHKCVYCDQSAVTGSSQPKNISAEITSALSKVLPRNLPAEVAFYGGTFTVLAQDLQREMLSAVRPYLDDGRVSSIRISTSPACISEKNLEMLFEHGVRTVELGVQSLNYEVLTKSGRNYTVDVVREAVNKLKKYAFSVGIQLMPGLPGDSKKITLESTRQVVEMKPDFVRVYPTVVIEGTILADLWRDGLYNALKLDEAIVWCSEITSVFREMKIPIIRMGLHPSENLQAQILAGPYHPAFKALVDSAMALEKIKQIIEPIGDTLTIFCNPAEISLVRGDKNSNIQKLKDSYKYTKINVKPKGSLLRGDYTVAVDD